MGFTVAIDGPAASGKGTIARAVAERFGFGHLDTGLLYRATGRRLLDGEDPLEAARTLRAADLDRPDLRGGDVAQAASRVATDPEVRAALLDFQRAFARRSGGAVLDGRDIGTVICPDAEAKLFITASQDVRAARRHGELTAAGETPTLDDVIADLRQRDTRDAARASAPMISAADAVLIDTSSMEISDAVEAACAVVARAMEARGTARG